MDRWKALLVGAVLVVAVSAGAAGPAAAASGAHGTTSQGKSVELRLWPRGDRVRLRFGFSVTCFNYHDGNVFTYEDRATVLVESTPYTVPVDRGRLETRVRFNFSGSRTVVRDTLYGDVNIAVAGNIRVLGQARHLRATGTIQATATLHQGDDVIDCNNGTAPITYKASSDLP